MDLEIMLTRLVWLWHSLQIVKSASTGAKLSACADMLPDHNALPQSLPVPYEINLSTTMYGTGSNVTVTLLTNTIEGFKGFLCQSRKEMGEYRTYGHLTQAPGQERMTNNCGQDVASVTQVSPSIKTRTSFLWTAPNYDAGQISIVCTVVQEYSTFWMNVTSPLLHYSPNCSSSYTTTPSLPSSTDGSWSTTSNSSYKPTNVTQSTKPLLSSTTDSVTNTDFPSSKAVSLASSLTLNLGIVVICATLLDNDMHL